MSYTNIISQIADGISTITINRPQQLNVLNKQTIEELNSALNELENNASVRVVIITGAGEKAFVAGADIKEFAQFSTEQGKQLSAKGHELLFDKVANFSKPVIAAINGFALGGGLELAMACHIRIASENARMGLPEVGLGVIPGYGGTQRLPQLIGKSKAMEMILTAEMIDVKIALHYGLINRVVPSTELLAKATDIAKKIMKNSPMALTSAIKAVNANYTDGLNGFAEEIKLFGECFGTKDFEEGTTAFLEKRKANF
ncbi:MAG: enoyl-CoA hydratase/isomerase family protein [Flavobacteriales bacterium]